MKISNSKKELARIISENGGWRERAGFAAQDQNATVTFFVDAPWRCETSWEASEFEAVDGFGVKDMALKNWHQSILSRDEYFHLYPVPDADGWIEWKGGERPVDDGDLIDVKFSDGDALFGVDSGWDWGEDAGGFNIIAYRLHKLEQVKPELGRSVVQPITEPEIQSEIMVIAQVDDINVVESKPAIEQLASDYRNAKDYAERKQQEADDAKADANEALRKLELAGEAHGLLVTPITEKQEPELVITDWRDLRAGDVISVSGKWWKQDSEYTVDENDGSRDAPIRVGGYWAIIGECSFKFIRRP